MGHRYAKWVVAAACMWIAVTPAADAADREGAAPDAAPSATALYRAALFASHGEPSLAWDALRSSGPARTDADARLAVRVLAELGRYAQAESLLAREEAPGDRHTALLYYLRRARLALQAGRADRALELAAAADSPGDDPLSAYLEYVRHRAYMKKGDRAAAAAALDRARASQPPDALAGPIDDARVDVLCSLGRSAEALATLQQRIARTANAPERRRLLLERYRIALAAGDDAHAANAAQVLLEDYRTFAEAETCALEVTRPLHDAGRVSEVSTPLLFACAEVFQARDRIEDSRRALRTLDQRSLEAGGVEHRRLLWGEYHFEIADYSRSLALARPSYTAVEYKRRSMLLYARSLRAMGRPVEAARAYEEFARVFPNDAMAADALYAAASLYDGARERANNVRVLDQLRHAYPSSFHGWAAAVRRARQLQSDGQIDQAAAIFDQWLTRSRRTDEAALFYLARLRESAGAANSAGMLLDELRRVNPYSFYATPDIGAQVRGPAHSASGIVAREGEGSLSSWLAGTASERERAYARVVAAAQGEGGAGDDGGARAALERARAFLAVGFRDWAERELEVARRSAGASPNLALELARTYEEYAMPWRSVPMFERARVGLAWETRREHADDFRFLMYPLPYPARVFDAAARNGIPAQLVYAMIREESRFETEAVSRAGAIGLMQLMPETAQRVAKRMELSPEVARQLNDPGVNISIGTWYASDLLRAGDGSVAWMLAAYNAGPGAAQRWIEPGARGERVIAEVESIDYRETRGYVKRVVESANVYHALYFDAAGVKNSPR